MRFGLSPPAILAPLPARHPDDAVGASKMLPVRVVATVESV
jgi:hypothetical protein